MNNSAQQQQTLSEQIFKNLLQDASIYNAKEWDMNGLPEQKFQYSKDYLGLQVLDDVTKNYIRILERKFEALLCVAPDLPVKKKRPTLRILIMPADFQKRAINE